MRVSPALLPRCHLPVLCTSRCERSGPSTEKPCPRARLQGTMAATRSLKCGCVDRCLADSAAARAQNLRGGCIDIIDPPRRYTGAHPLGAPTVPTSTQTVSNCEHMCLRHRAEQPFWQGLCAVYGRVRACVQRMLVQHRSPREARPNTAISTTTTAAPHEISSKHNTSVPSIPTRKKWVGAEVTRTERLLLLLLSPYENGCPGGPWLRSRPPARSRLGEQSC